MAKGKDKKKDKKAKKQKLEAAVVEKQKLATVQVENPTTPGEENAAEGSPAKMSRKEFEKEMEKLQVELVKLQEWVKFSGAKICVLFEGRDTAGKGGVIKRIIERVSPRVFRVVALGTPTDREKSQMYFQRYMPYLPGAGEVILFDRSWYNRAGVERVMGFATPQQVEHFLKFAPAVEREIVKSGVYLIKYWLEVDMDEQAKRFKERNDDYRKIWKLSPMDVQAQARWYDYSKARDVMFEATDTPDCPWYVVPSNDQRRARLNCITHFLSLIPYEEVPREPIKFPKRQEKGKYEEPDYPYRVVPQKF
jgi:polyphosphate kinase 2